MHGERFSVTRSAADIINAALGRVIAIGTTTVRALESAAGNAGVRETQEKTHTCSSGQAISSK